MCKGFNWKNRREVPHGNARKTGRMQLKQIVNNKFWEGVDWVDVYRERRMWRAVVNTVMNLRVL
jgi:hypothetical protein